MKSRRRFIGGAAALAFAGGASSLAFTNRASAGVGSDLTLSGDEVETDDGRIDTLNVTVSDGWTEYDGLDTDAASVEVQLHAAPSGGDVSAAKNVIHTAQFSVADVASLDTRAGSLSFEFIEVDAFAAQDVYPGLFRAQMDGDSKDTDIDFCLEADVRDADGNVLTSSSAITTVTVTVTNQQTTGGAGNGGGGVSASGPDQSP